MGIVSSSFGGVPRDGGGLSEGSSIFQVGSDGLGTSWDRRVELEDERTTNNYFCLVTIHFKLYHYPMLLPTLLHSPR